MSFADTDYGAEAVQIAMLLASCEISCEQHQIGLRSALNDFPGARPGKTEPTGDGKRVYGDKIQESEHTYLRSGPARFVPFHSCPCPKPSTESSPFSPGLPPSPLAGVLPSFLRYLYAFLPAVIPICVHDVVHIP